MLGVSRALYFFNFGFALSLIFHVSPPFLFALQGGLLCSLFLPVAPYILSIVPCRFGER